MFYKAEEPHNLAHNPFKAIVAPRPIGWISTLSKEGIANVAPYSFFNGINDAPMMVMFSSGGAKDSLTNAVDTGEFTFNFVSSRSQDQMNISSGGYPHNTSEFDLAGLTMVPGETVSCPRVKGVPAALECKLLEVVKPICLDGEKSFYEMAIGQVTGIHIDDAMITDGRFDLVKADPIMRCGYRDYMRAGDLFEMTRPPGAGGMA